MRHVLERLKLGTFMLSGLALIILGAAGYATFVEAADGCLQEANNQEFISGTFIPAKEK